MPRPYVCRILRRVTENQDAVKMIRYHHKVIQNNAREML